MWVKVCGLQDPSLAEELARLPVDAVGLNRYPDSRRFVRPDRVAPLVRALRSVEAPPEVVGVYVNENPRRIRDEATDHDFDRVQLHGDESPEDVERVEQDVRVIKALRVHETFGPEDLDRYDVGTYLLDADEPGRYGGTGRRAPWDLVAPLTERYRIVLAGGLGPDNVQEAVRAVSPWGVDVCSGVEDPEGNRDLEAVRALLAALEDGSGTDREVEP